MPPKGPADFRLAAPYGPAGDQPKAIEALSQRLAEGQRHNVLLGVTGSGKTFTIANVIQQAARPTLLISHNKTLAAQLYSELKQFFPDNAVEYFVSYFDYYQPEAYIPRTDTYIEKDSSINEEIERLRLSATSSLLTRRDVIVVASVSCIYGLGSPEDYEGMVLPVKTGQALNRENFLARLVEIQYERGDFDLSRGRFRVRGDVVELCPASDEEVVRVEFWGDEVEKISRIDGMTGNVLEVLDTLTVFPAKHFVTPHEKLRRAMVTIRQELDERIGEFEAKGKYLEAQRLKMRTTHDLDMIEEMGFCNGIENYSRHLTGRPPGSRPFTLLDFFPDDFLLVIDESHATVPQISGMYEGDRSRKTVLVEHGFRLPSALDNRPLNFEEFQSLFRQVIYVSATPGPYELKQSGGQVVEQVIRPTGLLDPVITLRPLKGQIDETIGAARQRIERGERVLVTTLTKRTAEDLTDYLAEAGFKVRYIHSEVDAIERVEILRELRGGTVDVLVGINLLREGLDLPEVSLVCILDADKEGYLRSETSLIQTAGRAARHVNGEVLLFADTMTGSIRRLLEVTRERREKQMAYNRANGITPQSVRRGIQESLHSVAQAREVAERVVKAGGQDLDVTELLSDLEKEMWEAAKNLEYEKAALLRDQIGELKRTGAVPEGAEAGTVVYPKKPRGGGRKKLSK
jgi:excinuclease ABC subunit B